MIKTQQKRRRPQSPNKSPGRNGEKVVYLMRGLPSCGKSHTAKRLAGESGVVCTTDEFFFTQVGDDPSRYDFCRDRMNEARQWNLNRFQRAIDQGQSPVVVDRGNGLNAESSAYARYAAERGYRVELREPESEWWQEIRVLLKYKDLTRDVLYEWADKLAANNRSTHRTPANKIRHWMDRWRHDITVEEIVNF